MENVVEIFENWGGKSFRLKEKKNKKNKTCLVYPIHLKKLLPLRHFLEISVLPIKPASHIKAPVSPLQPPQSPIHYSQLGQANLSKMLIFQASPLFKNLRKAGSGMQWEMTWTTEPRTQA